MFFLFSCLDTETWQAILNVTHLHVSCASAEGSAYSLFTASATDTARSTRTYNKTRHVCHLLVVITKIYLQNDEIMRAPFPFWSGYEQLVLIAICCSGPPLSKLISVYGHIWQCSNTLHIVSQSLPLPFTRKRHSQVNVVLFVLICKVGLCVTCVFGEFAFLIKFCLRDGGSMRVVILLINVAFAYLSLENVRTCSWKSIT